MAPKTTKKKSSLKKNALKGARPVGPTRRLARATVQQSRDFLRQVIDINPHFIFAKDRDGRFTLVNQAVADAYGTTIEELIGKTDADFNPRRAEVEFFRKMDREVMDSKQERFIPEEVITDATGKQRWLQTIKRPIIDKDGRAYQVLGISTDVTERRKAETALRESEQRFHAIYDQTYEFIGLLTPDGTLIDINQTALMFRGLQRADVVGKLFWETPWWDLSRELQEKLKAAVAEAATGEFVRLRAQHQDQEGMIEEIDFSLTPITDRAGRVTQIIPEGRRITTLTRLLDQLREAQAGLEHRVRERTAALTQLTEQLRAEITERKRVQEMLHARSAELQITLNTAATGLVRNSRDLRYRWVNMAYAKLVGRPLEEIVGRMLSDVLGAEGLATFRPYIDRVLSGERVEFETALPTSHRGLRWLHVVYMPDRDAAGDVIGWVGSINDITERKQTELLLQSKEGFISDVLNSLSAHVCVLDQNGVILRTNESWERFARANSDTTSTIGEAGENYLDVCRRAIANGDTTVGPILAGIEAVMEGRAQMFSAEYPCDSPKETRWFLLRVSPLVASRGVVLSHLDISDRKLIEDELLRKQQQVERSQEKLEDLTAKLITAQDSERQRIARDLHDDFSQRLAAVAIDIASLQRHPPLLPELIRKALEPVRVELQQLASDLHDLAYRLHPPLLRHLGLQAAVEEDLLKAIERTGLRITLRARDIPDSIPLDWSICLFRVLQESLQNVVKHAAATEVQVRLSGSSKGIGLSVIDNGKGFDAQDEATHLKGLGLSSMQERLRLLNGFLNIHSRPVKGTKVCAWIPFRENTL